MNKNTISRKEQSKLTKEKIFASAVNLISKYGYNNISVDQICKEAGVAKGTFYVHYKSKEDIVRESYYSDMSEYIIMHYDNIKKEFENLTIKQYIIKFLCLEFKFTQYAGYELTCLAFATNFSSCIPGPCQHLKKREFTKILKELLLKAYENKLIKNSFSVDEVFMYLETGVRGMMATWCFSNGDFNIEEVGTKFVVELVDNFIF